VPSSSARNSLKGLDALTVGEAATLIGITEQSVRRLAGAGAIAARKHGRDWLVDAASARAYADRDRRPGRPRRTAEGGTHT
jgi:excisionase family DNA binding protein